MATEIIPTRRKFRSAWDEIYYLYHKILYWFYQQEDRRGALRFAPRLEVLLQKADPQEEAISGHECRSVLAELHGDLPAAIQHREKEIRLIRRLWEITPAKEFPPFGLGPDDLSDRLDLLAILYHDTGKLEKAIAILQESRQLCQKHRVPFDGKDLLRDYQVEQRNKLQTVRA
jgi:tetratricopeptide (TPR) repeat protein